MATFSKHTLLAVSAALMLLPVGAPAQSPAPQSGNAGQEGAPPDNQQNERRQQQRRQAAIAGKLNLTDDQKQQWVRIQRQTAQEVKAARNDNSLSAEQAQAKLKEIHQQTRRQLMALLSPEQQQELKKLWEEQRQKQQQNSPNPNSGPGQDKGNKQDQDDAQADDFFAGMVQDQAPAKKAPPK